MNDMYSGLSIRYGTMSCVQEVVRNGKHVVVLVFVVLAIRNPVRV
jgi:hypothetical protein